MCRFVDTFKIFVPLFSIYKISAGLFISMTVDNRNQDDDDGYSGQKLPSSSNKDFKENEALNLQTSPLEKVFENVS